MKVNEELFEAGDRAGGGQGGCGVEEEVIGARGRMVISFGLQWFVPAPQEGTCRGGPLHRVVVCTQSRA